MRFQTDFDPDAASMDVLNDTLRLGIQISRELLDRSKQPASKLAAVNEGGIR